MTRIGRELLALERQYWQAVKDQDVDTCLVLTDTPCIVAGAQGIAKVEAERLAEMMQCRTHSLEDFQIDDRAEVRQLSDDVAVLAYKVHEVLTVEGQRVELDAAETSTWVRRGGAWRCALHTESIVGDPFGRDRLPARA